MSRFHEAEAGWSLDLLKSLSLMNACEVKLVQACLAESMLAACLERAETLHVHVKVDDTHRVPRALLEAAGAELDHERDGFVKFRLPGGINAIFSHIPVSADDLREQGSERKRRPSLDHIGIDVRTVDEASRAAFGALPAAAAAKGWAHVPQGGAGRAVKCCHVEVAEKHWVFPVAAGSRPIEIAFGPLKQSESGYGCDLRPAHPALGVSATACCAA